MIWTPQKLKLCCLDADGDPSGVDALWRLYENCETSMCPHSRYVSTLPCLQSMDIVTETMDMLGKQKFLRICKHFCIVLCFWIWPCQVLGIASDVYVSWVPQKLSDVNSSWVVDNVVVIIKLSSLMLMTLKPTSCRHLILLDNQKISVSCVGVVAYSSRSPSRPALHAFQEE